MRERDLVRVGAQIVCWSLLVLAACPSSPPPAPGVPGVPATPSPTPQVPAPPGGGGQITISPGAGGGMQIEGIPALHGDPAACATYQACCAPFQGQISPAGLACGLAPGGASNGDCAQALQTVRGVFSEQNIPMPAGCAP